VSAGIFAAIIIADVVTLALGYPLPPVHLHALAMSIAVTLGVAGIVSLHTRETLSLARRLEEARASAARDSAATIGGTVIDLPPQPDRRSRVGAPHNGRHGPHWTRH
jgi:hypothetical protein